MNNEQRRDKYETQKGITYLDPEVRQAKLTGKQRKRLRKHEGENSHEHVKGEHCTICRTPATSSA
jgi:hypothetical protein